MWPALQYLVRSVTGSPSSPLAATAEVDPDTGAAPVVPPVIKPLVSGSSERDRIITPYRADAFERRLRRLNLLNKYPHLPGRIRNGFPMGDFSPLEKTYTSDIYNSGLNHLDFIEDYVKKQKDLGRMTGPYGRNKVESILGSKFMTSPLFVIDKAGSPGKFRLIQDLSSKNEDGFSVNDSIDSDDFPTMWVNAAAVAQIVADAPEGAQAASLDIDSAYRNIPISPEHKPYFVIQTNRGEFYIDHVCPFGVASGAGLQGQLMDAILDILDCSGIKPTAKWVDDVVSFRFPKGKNARGEFVYSHDVEDIFRLTEDLGVPWKLGKCFRYAELVLYVGFLWNLRDRCVSVPDKNRKKYIDKLQAFRTAAQSDSVSHKDTMSILGTLSHLTFVYVSGRSYLPNLTSFAAAFPHPGKRRFVPVSVKKDLQWWLKTLKTPNFSRSLSPRSTDRDPGVWVVSHTSPSSMIGILIDKKWALWELVGEWKSEGRDVGWVEMLAIELACLYLEVLNISNADIVVHSDSRGIGRVLQHGRSRNIHTNLSIRRIEFIITAANVNVVLEYVEPEKNRAEPVARGGWGRKKQRLPGLERLPVEIQPFLRLVQQTSPAVHRANTSQSATGSASDARL